MYTYKHYWILNIFICMLYVTGPGQTYHLNVLNGYGSGDYSAGDTVHIWSKEMPSSQYFSHWSGYTATLGSEVEWHTTLVMPASNKTVMANFLNYEPEVVFTYEEIQGAENSKQVYYAFPDGDDLIGVVYVFHSFGGNAQAWISDFEKTTCVKRLRAENFGVIITDCEETTLDDDINGDGRIGWSFDVDTAANIDIQNILALRDTFIQRGYFNPETEQLSFGTSGGGAFATHIAALLHFKAAVSNHGTGVEWAMPITEVPMMFIMNEHDDNGLVGIEGNAQAYADYISFLDRNVCAAYSLLNEQPLYPERFARVDGIGQIGLSLSDSIYNELNLHGMLDMQHKLVMHPTELYLTIIGNLVEWPVMASLTTDQFFNVFNQLKISFGTHVFHNDYLGASIEFMKNLCGCHALTSVLTESVTSTTAVLSWLDQGVSNYKIKYRAIGGPSVVSTVTFDNNITLNDLTPGATYKLLVSYTCQNGEKFSKSHTFSTPLRLSDEVGQKPVLLPNPSHGVCWINHPEQIVDIQFFTIEGLLVKTVTPDQSEQIDVSALQDGCYIVCIKQVDQSTTIQRLIILH